MISNWKRLSDETPPDGTIVLAVHKDPYDNDPTYASGDYYADIFGREGIQPVKTIAPPLTTETDTHWMDIPPDDDERWIRDRDPPEDGPEVLIHLGGEKIYVFCPCFRSCAYSMRMYLPHGCSIDKWMPLPEHPWKAVSPTKARNES